MAVIGELFDELELKASADKVWEIYSSPKVFKMVEEQLPHIVKKIDLIEGDGNTGTIIHAKFQPEAGFGEFKEKFTNVDHKKRLKETEVIEGGYLSMGFIYFRYRIEIVEKDKDCCLIKSSVRYEAPDEETAQQASCALLQSLAAFVQKTLQC